jgi:hypothetical protein
VRRPNSPPDGGGWVIGLASSALSFIKCGGPTGALLGPGNPVTASFGATLHREVLKTLRLRGHEVDDCDLYPRDRFHDVVLWPAAGFVDRQLS